MAISLILFLVAIYFFQLSGPNIFILLIYPLASTVLCTLLVYYLTASILVPFISMAINNLFLIFIVIPLSGGLSNYPEMLQLIVHANTSHGLLSYLEVFAAASLLISLITVKVCRLITKCRSKDVFISDRTWKREFLS